MKSLSLFLVVLGLAGTVAFADETNTNAVVGPLKLTAAEARDHIGTNAVVTGKVAEIHKGASTVNLNFGNAFPKQLFTAVIFSRNTNQFPDLDKMKDKTVEVTGKIVDYKDKPEIVVTSTNQLKVVEKEERK